MDVVDIEKDQVGERVVFFVLVPTAASFVRFRIHTVQHKEHLETSVADYMILQVYQLDSLSKYTKMDGFLRIFSLCNIKGSKRYVDNSLPPILLSVFHCSMKYVVFTEK